MQLFSLIKQFIYCVHQKNFSNQSGLTNPFFSFRLTVQSFLRSISVSAYHKSTTLL